MLKTEEEFKKRETEIVIYYSCPSGMVNECPFCYSKRVHQIDENTFYCDKCGEKWIGVSAFYGRDIRKYAKPSFKKLMEKNRWKTLETILINSLRTVKAPVKFKVSIVKEYIKALKNETTVPHLDEIPDELEYEIVSKIVETLI